MMAFAWKMLAWFGIGVAVALGVLIVPLHVAAERKKLDTTTSAITQARRDIRALETEFETRSNIAQLERWNGETLRLAAPVAGQYLRDEAQLASLDFDHPMGGAAVVQTASLIVPQHNAQPTTSVATSAPASAPAPVVVSVAVASAVAPAPFASAPAASAVEVRAAVRRPRPQAVALLDRKLLSDSMLGDLTSGASAEAGRLH